MNSPLCRKLAAGESPEPGDVGAIRSAAGSEVHGFVYLTPEVCFSKNGFSKEMPYGLSSLNGVIEGYRKYATTPAGPAKTEYYRCVSFNDYVRAHGGQLPQAIRTIMGCLDRTERQIADVSVFGASADLGLLRTTLDVLQALTEQEEQTIELSQDSSARQADEVAHDLDLTHGILLQIKALRFQLQLIRGN
jgi:hypothetical protein